MPSKFHFLVAAALIAQAGAVGGGAVGAPTTVADGAGDRLISFICLPF